MRRPKVDGAEMFQAGTKADGGEMLANGGRVLNVSATRHDGRRGAGDRAYEAVDRHRLAGRLLPPRYRLAGGGARGGP